MPPPPDDDTSTVGSNDWFAASFGLVLCGKRMSNEKVKQLVYGGGVVMLFLFVFGVYHATNTTEVVVDGVPKPVSAGYSLSTQHAINMEYYTPFDDDTTGRPPSIKKIIQVGTQCRAFDSGWDSPGAGDIPHSCGEYPFTPVPSSARETGGCGLTPDSEVFAYHRGGSAYCGDGADPECGWTIGPIVHRGCSRIDYNCGTQPGYYIECCVEVDLDGADSCVASVDLDHAGDSDCGAAVTGENVTLTGGNCCTGDNRPDCNCTGVSTACVVETDGWMDSKWVDLSGGGLGHRIGSDEWQQNDDDGWLSVNLQDEGGFYFQWFGKVEDVITIGTNGLLTFGSDHLPHGGSEPVPCASTAENDCGYAATVQMDGVIAPLWCDLDPGHTFAEDQEGVFYLVDVHPTDPNQNRLVVEWRAPTWGTTTMLHFQVVLSANGAVTYQYNSMPVASTGSWSTESIGFEDHTGEKGIQISYGVIPANHTRYDIHEECHLLAGGTCTDKCDAAFEEAAMNCACRDGCAKAVVTGNLWGVFQSCTDACATSYSLGQTCLDTADACSDNNCGDPCEHGCYLATYGQ